MKLPRLSGAACVAALTKAGFAVKRQQGSHIILRRDLPYAQVVVPNHGELDRGNSTRHHSVGRTDIGARFHAT